MNKKCLIVTLILLFVLVIATPSILKAGEVTAVVTPSCSASDSVAACISEGDRYSVITYYIKPLGNLNKGIASYITLVVLDKKTGKVFITKIPERDFGNKKTFMLDLRRPRY